MTNHEPAARQTPPPFPVVLDLSDDLAYAALTEYAERIRHQAEDEAENANPNQYQVAYLQKVAETAEGLAADVERQLDEAGEAAS
jgi:hypothetical protein